MAEAEVELVVFATLLPDSIKKLFSNNDYVEYVQPEISSTSSTGTRITNRARSILAQGETNPKYLMTTKFRFNKETENNTSRSIEIEKEIQLAEFEMLRALSERCYVKRRVKLNLGGKLTAEIDIFKCASNGYYDTTVKIDVEGATDKSYQLLIDGLKTAGIQIAKVLNPPEANQTVAREEINRYMQVIWNHASAG